jgi:hypothetical protein
MTAIPEGAAPAERECAASISGDCLNASHGSGFCDTDAGECIHAGRPATSATPAARLREAATVVREVSAKATPGPWSYNRWHSDTCKPGCDDPACFRVLVGSPRGTVGTTDVDRDPPEVFYAVGSRAQQQGEGDAAWIALMHPGVGDALAAWLETEALAVAGDEDHASCSADTCTTVAALALADAILAAVTR